MLERCGEQYRRRYIDKHRIPPGVALIVGTAVDGTVTKNLGNKITTNELLPIEQIVDDARDLTMRSFDREGVALDSDEEKRGLKVVKAETIDKAIRLSRLHATSAAPSLNPTHVQRPFVLELSGFPVNLAGTIDVQEGSHSIRDTKTSAKTPGADVAEKSDQLTMYALGAKIIDGKIPDQVALDYLIDTKTPAHKTFTSERTEDDFRPLLNRVEVAVRALEKGVFIPVNPDHWVCSARYCGYWNTCPFVRRPKSIATLGGEAA